MTGEVAGCGDLVGMEIVPGTVEQDTGSLVNIMLYPPQIATEYFFSQFTL